MWVMISVVSILLYILFTILEGYKKYCDVGE